VAGKTISEPEGGWTGWEALEGTVAMSKGAAEIWKSYTPAEQQDIAAKHAVIYACIGAIANRVPEADTIIGKDGPDGWGRSRRTRSERCSACRTGS